VPRYEFAKLSSADVRQCPASFPSNQHGHPAANFTHAR